MKKGIVLNRMYAGQYLHHNIGHEVINFFQADDGNHYLYLNATGDFASSHQGRIGSMLLVKYHRKGVVEVVGMATGLSDVYDPDCRNNEEDSMCTFGADVKYGGIPLSSLFQGNQQQSIYVTYRAAQVYVPVRRIFIRFAQAAEDPLLHAVPPATENQPGSCQPESAYVVTLKALNLSTTSLKQYLYPGPDRPAAGVAAKDTSVQAEESVTHRADYDALYHRLIARSSDPTLWEVLDGSIPPEPIAQHQPSLFDICQIQDNENCFSNALAYFMRYPPYRQLWKGFFATLDIPLNDTYGVEREYDISDAGKNSHKGRIDLLLVDREGDRLVVIENKIKSGIHCIATPNGSERAEAHRRKDYGNQLERYAEFSSCFKNPTTDEPFRHVYLFVLAPNYNLPEIPENLKDRYTVLTYKDLYDYLNRDEVRREWCGDSNFSAFVEAIRKHTYPTIGDYLRHEMESAFLRKVAETAAQKA